MLMVILCLTVLPPLCRLTAWLYVGIWVGDWLYRNVTRSDKPQWEKCLIALSIGLAIRWLMGPR